MKKHVGIICTICALASCTEQDSIWEKQYAGDSINLQSEIVQEYTTRANDGGFTDGDNIGVFIVNRDEGEAQPLKATGNHADNVRFTFCADPYRWESAYPLYWKDKTTHVDAYGYYPFDHELANVEAYPFTLQHNQRDILTQKNITGYEASDFLWAKAEDVAPGTLINLKHRHIMAGVEVTLVEGEYFDEGEWAGLEKSVLIQNTCAHTNIDLGTGTVTISNPTPVSIIPIQRDAVWRAVVAPQTVDAGKILLTITVDGISYEFQRNEDMNYVPGKLHRFAISVDKRLPEGDYQFSLISEAITAWENDPESHNGTAREYTIVHVNEGQSLEETIKTLGLDLGNIVNLKVTGTLSGSADFKFIRDNMENLEALNLKELRTQNIWKDRIETDVEDYIPSNAFENMYSLSYIVWPDSLKGIGDMAFAGAGLKGSLILPEGLKHIGGSVFAAYGHRPNNFTGELYIPSTVEYIGEHAFGSFDSKQFFWFTNELILPPKMKYMGECAFGGCRYMTGSIRIPEGIEEINDVWDGLSNLKGPVIIPQGVKKINGIGGCITELYVSEGVTEIDHLYSRGWQPWMPDGYRKMLRKVVLPSTLRKIGSQAFAECGFAHINLPEGLEIISVDAFSRCDLQDTLNIPSTVTKIERSAFDGCSMLNALILPESVVMIEDWAFSGCSSLDYIQCLGSTPPAITGSTFNGVEKDNFTVVVPEGAVEAYRNAEHWREFKRISTYRNFVCRPMQAKLLNKGHVRDIVLNADDHWTVKHCPDWISLDKTSGYKKTELKATIATMPHGQGNRRDSIVFQLSKDDEYGNPITCCYTVQQFDYEYEEDGVLQLQKATKGQRGGIDILFVGDGYDAEDIATETYRQHIEQEMEYFFAIEPYSTYKDYFNVSVAMAMSMESGVLDSPDKWRNTKFNITYGAGNNGRLEVPFEDIANYVLQDVENSPITAENNERSMVICVPNSDAYEGVTSIYGNGFSIAVCPHSTFDYPNDARGIIQHEAGGHGWGRLDDEYIYHQAFIQECGCICCSHVEAIQANHAMNFGRNLSLNGKYQQAEWKHLIFDSRYGDIVDMYEGGHMHSRGIYRSEANSCMNNNVPYYSTWSRQLIVERTLEAAGETFDFETFVSKDSRAVGDKFLTRAQLNTPWQNVKAIHNEHHGTIFMKGSPMDYIKTRRK